MARAVQPLRAEALRHQGHWTGEARPCRPRARLKETQGRPKFPGSPSGGRTPQGGGLGGVQRNAYFTVSASSAPRGSAGSKKRRLASLTITEPA